MWSPELVQMLVALAVQDDTQGGAGTPTQSTHMDHDRRDEVCLCLPFAVP